MCIDVVIGMYCCTLSSLCKYTVIVIVKVIRLALVHSSSSRKPCVLNFLRYDFVFLQSGLHKLKTLAQRMLKTQERLPDLPHRVTNEDN